MDEPRTLATERKAELMHRLRRAEGQVRGLQKLLEEGADCAKIAQQLLATPEKTPRPKKLSASPLVVSGARRNRGRVIIRPDRLSAASASISMPPAKYSGAW